MDQRVLRNPNLTESLCIDFLDNDFENNSFDIVFANNVVEHIKYPEEFLLEVKRLLKPNGHFFFKTPNLLHYAPIIANFTPFWFHKFYCGLSGRKHEDTFPTCYDLNTSMKIEKLSRKIKFDYQTITLKRQPDYLFLEPILFF